MFQLPRHISVYFTALIVLALFYKAPASLAADETLKKAVEADYAYLDELYVHFHQNPELSFQEKETSLRLAAELRQLGYEVTEGIGGYGIVGLMRNGDGPTLMIRADMDALPIAEQTNLPYASKKQARDGEGRTVPVMHACGHDIHMTVFIGVARQLAATKDHWRGTVMLTGQPAEERGAGARAMLADGLFERFPVPNYNIALHVHANLPAGKLAWVSGYALANVDSVDITVFGEGGHGAYPQATKDPIVLSSAIIMALQTLVSREIAPLEPAVVTVGSIHGGTKHNIIPDEVKLQLTVRSYTDEVRNRLLAGIERIAEYQARAFGLAEDRLPQVTVKDEHTRSTYNHPGLAARLVEVWYNQIGKDYVIEGSPVMGGEDFSEYGRTKDKIPSFMLWLGSVSPEKYENAKTTGALLPSLHSPFFFPAHKPTIMTGVESMTAAAFDLLGEP